MSWFQALMLGIVEGVTEYLPVSSTGHLILTQRLLGIGGGEAADAFAICIQAGAIAAVLGLYAGRVRQMARGLAGKDLTGVRLLVNLCAAFVPAAVVGLLFEKRIKAHLFNLPAITAAWLAGGIAILIASRWKSRQEAGRGGGAQIDDLRVRTALLIGAAQCLAMWPGTSRSLVTIVGGLLVGLGMTAAVEFSFLLGVVTLSAATAHDLLKHGHTLVSTYSASSLVVGFVVAAAAAAASIRWMVGYLRSHGLALFGWYRIALALAVGGWLLAVGPPPSP